MLHRVHQHIVSPFPSHLPEYEKNINFSEKYRSRPSDVFMYVPSKFKNELLSSKIWMYHDFTLSINYDVYRKVDYYLDTFHDSNSWGDKNPLFYISNRLETSIWSSEFYSHLGDGQPILNWEKNYNEVFKEDYTVILFTQKYSLQY